MGHDRRYSIDTSKAQTLGWKPARELDEAFAALDHDLHVRRDHGVAERRPQLLLPRKKRRPDHHPNAAQSHRTKRIDQR